MTRLDCGYGPLNPYSREFNGCRDSLIESKESSAVPFP